MIKRELLVSVLNPKGGGGGWLDAREGSYHRLKRMNKKILDYVGLILNYLRKRRVGGLET